MRYKGVLYNLIQVLSNNYRIYYHPCYGYNFSTPDGRESPTSFSTKEGAHRDAMRHYKLFGDSK